MINRIDELAPSVELVIRQETVNDLRHQTQRSYTPKRLDT